MFTLILSLSALAAEAAPITLTPAPAPTFLVGANPPVRVRGQTPVPSGAATSCVCDHERLGCAVQGGVMSAWWTVDGPGTWPVEEGEVGTCTSGQVTAPVVVRHELSTWHELWFRSPTEAVVTYVRGEPVRYSFALPGKLAASQVRSEPGAPVQCAVKGDGVTVTVIGDGDEAGSWPCAMTAHGELTVRLLPYDVR